MAVLWGGKQSLTGDLAGFLMPCFALVLYGLVFFGAPISVFSLVSLCNSHKKGAIKKDAHVCIS